MVYLVSGHHFYQYLIGVHDSVESVGDGENCAATEPLLDGLLNDGVSPMPDNTRLHYHM